ncbi:fimbrial protein [Pseudomonas helleri]|uniref:fimbrial protein n=1 Tax=Pseudomonas helleri TaxID=1608996 RepID=UPI00242E72F8|nr:fimbrial protein [Pseudomonas helleri]
MKTSLFIFPFGLALSLAATSAFAFDGTINFSGKISSATCPIEIVNPESGAVSNLVPLGSVDTGDFNGKGSEGGGRGFQMRITPGSSCVLDPAKLNATVTFRSVQGGGGDYYGIKPVAGAATGVAVAIKDNTGTLLKSGDASAIYPLSETDPTLMYFTAVYIATAGAVTAGPADADAEFRVDVN